MSKPLDSEASHAARLMIQKLVELARAMQDDRKLAMALHTLGHSQLLSAEHDEAERSFDESREVSLRLADRRATSISFAMLGFVDVSRSKLEDGLPRILDAVTEIDATDDARTAIILRLAQASKKFDRARFDAALNAAGRGRPSEVLDEIAKAVETVRGGA